MITIKENTKKEKLGKCISGQYRILSKSKQSFINTGDIVIVSNVIKGPYNTLNTNDSTKLILFNLNTEEFVIFAQDSFLGNLEVEKVDLEVTVKV